MSFENIGSNENHNKYLKKKRINKNINLDHLLYDNRVLTDEMYGLHVSCDHSVTFSSHSALLVHTSPHQPQPCGSLERTHVEHSL